MAQAVPAGESARKFGRYQLQAQREPAPFSSNGTLAGYFVAPQAYEALQKLRSLRRRFGAVELSDAEIEQIASARMDPRHDRLDGLLDPE